MLLYGERQDEIIAHFIGHFEVRLDEARARLDYDGFEHEADPEPELVEIATVAANPLQRLEIEYYHPGVAHDPVQWDPRGGAPFTPVAVPAIVSRQEIHAEVRGVEAVFPKAPHWHDGAQQQYAVSPGPGEVILVLNQEISLFDNDVVVFGTYEGPLTIDPGLALRLDALMADTLAPLASIASHDMSDGVDAIPEFVTNIAAAIVELAEALPPEGVTVHTDPSGSYVNGEAVAAVPELTELLPEIFKTEEPAADTELPLVSRVDQTLSGEEIDASISVQAGANLLTNMAMLTNTGLMGGVVAVAGDLHALDIIVQANGYSDCDSFADEHAAGAATKAFNIATFEQSQMATPEASPALAGVTPQGWNLSVIEGDAVFLQWVTQFSFVRDNDIHVLTETGAKTVVTSGANLAENVLSFNDLGAYYDLIIVGGSLYDSNMILQANVLLDDDSFASGTNSGAATSGGNLLYNSASIANIGAGNWLEGLPAHYLEAVENYANGRFDMPSGFGDDAGFAGMGGLSALLITGNVYDLHYVRQVNVLGDADTVKLAQEAMLESGANDDWRIETGANALVNVASIIDVDTMGDTAYVGGGVYSDAILIQADILACEPEGPGGDALVTEAIAFLGEDVTPLSDDDYCTSPTPADSGFADVMQSVLA